MRFVTLSIATPALMMAFAATSFAQATQPPKTTPPVAQQPAVQTPKPPTEPPAPFPADAKIAFIDFQQIANESQIGKDDTAKLKALNDKDVAALQAKNKQLQDMTAKRNQGGGVLSDAARAQLDKDIENLQRQMQFDQQTDKADITELQNQLQEDFQKKVVPVVEAIGKEKGLHAVFSTGDAGVIYMQPGLDITQEVIKRLDAATSVKKN